MSIEFCVNWSLGISSIALIKLISSFIYFCSQDIIGFQEVPASSIFIWEVCRIYTQFGSPWCSPSHATRLFKVSLLMSFASRIYWAVVKRSIIHLTTSRVNWCGVVAVVTWYNGCVRCCKPCCFDLLPEFALWSQTMGNSNWSQQFIKSPGKQKLETSSASTLQQNQFSPDRAFHPKHCVLLCVKFNPT